MSQQEQVHKAAKGVDIIFHAAAYFGFPAFSSNSFGDHQKVLDININGTSNVLQVLLFESNSNHESLHSATGLHRK